MSYGHSFIGLLGGFLMVANFRWLMGWIAVVLVTAFVLNHPVLAAAIAGYVAVQGTAFWLILRNKEPK